MEADTITSHRPGGVSGGLAGSVTAIGGAAISVGTFLAFATVEAFRFSESVTGWETDSNWYYLGSGLALVVLGLAIAVARQATVQRVLGALGVLVAGLATVVSIMDIIGLEDEIPAEALGQVSVSPEIGLYLAVAGAIVGLIGSVMALFARERAVVAAPPPPPPPPPGSQPPQSPPAAPES